MNWNQYQRQVVELLSDESKNDQLVNSVLGLNGEAGEVADLVKKHKHHNHEFDRRKFLLELGDCLFYIAEGADAVGATLEEVALLNVQKLINRYPTGKFTTQDSIDKKDQVRELIFDPEDYPEDKEFGIHF